MKEKEIRELISVLSGNDVLVSIPASAGFFGDIEAISKFPYVKERMMSEGKPIRIISPGVTDIKAFVYGESSKMKSNPEYLDKFIEMSLEFGEVSDIFCMMNNSL